MLITPGCLHWHHILPKQVDAAQLKVALTMPHLKPKVSRYSGHTFMPLSFDPSCVWDSMKMVSKRQPIQPLAPTATVYAGIVKTP